jgi:hypothetical protein
MSSAPQPRRGVAAATAAVIGFFVAAVFPRATWPLIDGDVWWHIRAGEDVLRSGAIPRVDTWSIVGLGRPWTSQDWLANVVLAIGNDLGPWGQTALSLLYGLLTVAAFWILWRAIGLRVPEIGWASRVTWLSIGLLLAGPVMGVRVQVLDLLMASVVIWICWRFLADPRRRWLALLPVVAAVWANLHAGWVLLFLLAGAVLVGEAVDLLLRRQPAGAPLLGRKHLAELAVALLISGAALAINPNGLDLYAYPLETVGITALNRYVMEWFPASIDTLFGQLLLGFVLVAVLPALVIGRRTMRTSDALIMLGLTFMAYQAIRFLLITGPIGAAIAAVVLAPQISASGPGRRVSRVLDRLATPRFGTLRTVNLTIIGLLLALGIGVAFLRVSPPTQEAEIARSMPAGAVRWLEEHEPGERIFNRYEWGGYVGQQRPDLPIFMDGRADVYGDELLQMYVSIIGVQDDPQVLLDRYQIDHALFPPDTPLAGWFDASPAWERAYADDTAVVWLRR